MTLPISAELLIALNREHGGPGAGVASEDGVRACADRPFAQYSGVEVFPTIWEKAAALLHGVASTQHFSDGNKRTATVAAILFLEQNGVALRKLPRISKEAAVLATATNLLDVQDTAEWLREHVLTASDRVEHAVLSLIDDVESMEPDNLYHQFPARILGHYEVPRVIRYGLNTRLSWAEIDAGQAKGVFVMCEFSEGDPVLLLDRSIAAVSGEVERVPVAQWAPQGLQVWNPTFVLTFGVRGSFDGYVKLFIDGEVAWTDHISFTVDAGLRDLHARL